MSEEEGPKYKDGDIVWVKLGSCWWPGEVTENGPEDFTSKKPPLAIVKFFNETTYEFVKSHNQIYDYNCDRKNEFIRKGMDSFRGNNAHMAKFPGDVSLAEIRTDGNPNILSDPMFAPQNRSAIIAEVFGSPSPKKTPKENKSVRRTSKGSKKPKVNITHRRFLGCDDYEAHIRVQYPGKDKENLSSDDEVVRLNAEPSETFNCSQCTFNTKRLQVMLFHVQCHIKGIATPVHVKKRSSPKKKKKTTRVFKHITSDDDRTNSTGFLDTDSEEEIKEKPKRKKKSASPRKPKTKKEEEKPTTDIRSNLLAEWSDSEENQEGETSKVDSADSDKKDDKKKEEKQDLTKSCFDFDEDEEEDSSIVHTAVGRKIPRVIPPNKRKSTDPDNEDASLPLAEDDENRMEILKGNENLNESSNSVPNDSELAKVEEDFKDLMDSTLVPELPDVPGTVKPEKNFTDTKTAKTPDKKNDSEVATKLTNPKKRFVKSFEDYELLQNEQRKAQEEKDEEKKKVEASPVADTPESVEPVADSSREETPMSDPIEEPSPVPEDKKEEKSEEISDGSVETPEPKTNDEKKNDPNLQISKLKCQIMSKLGDDETESPKVAKLRSHRSPRSKILESYRNDKSKERKSIDKEETVEEKKERPATRKSKFLKNFTEESEKTEEEPAKEEATKSDIIKEVEAIPEKNPDEEIGKINQIDEYLNDFLFNFPKKEDTPPKMEETSPKKEETPEKTLPKPSEVEEKSSNEVQLECAGNQEGGVNFSIRTDETNLNKPEELSALSTLAMVSQLETSEKPEEIKPPFEPEPELVTIDGNLTVVSEKDLADGQVEITANASPTCKKPVTLTNFSMDFSECNSNSNSDSVASLETKEPEKTPGPDEILDLEEHIPSQIVDKKNVEASPTPSKLLERLTEAKPKIKVPTKDSTKPTKTKFVIKSSVNKIIKSPPPSNKPIILSEKIIKPLKTTEGSGSVSVQKITSKRNLHDADEIDAFIIQKGQKNVEEDENDSNQDFEIPSKRLKKTTPTVEVKKTPPVTTPAIKKRGKAKILQQTIITPAGEIIQPTVTTTASAAAATVTQDDNVFDINSMPIVLSDQILTPESIENMPIYLSDSVQSTPEPTTPKITTIVKKPTVSIPQNQMRVLNKSIASPAPKLVKTPKILGSVGSKLIKQNSFASGTSKHGKYVIVTQAPGTTTTSKFTVGKKQIIKRMSDVGMATTGTLTKVQNIAPEPTGNKIMILTDQQGQQQRVLLTPAQQKMMGYQSPGAKITKTMVKGNIIQKGKDGQMTAVPGSSGLVSKTINPSRLGSQLITSTGQVLSPIHQTKNIRIDKSTLGRKIQMQSQKVQIKPPQQKTILIKNQHGQTVRKIQGTDDALLDKQVAEQLEAIKASGILQQKQEILNYKTTPKATFRRSYPKKIEAPKPVQKPKETVVPPLAPISPKKPEVEKQETKQERALHQLVIQDAMGNQTTITEGQILALPSETIDGQPQSYMLVTLDESGNLTPLNNEALLSLDPNLGLGGDLGNTVLQIDQSALKEEPVVSQAEVTQQETVVTQAEPVVSQPEVAAPKPEEKPQETPETPQEQITDTNNVMPTMGESGQQLIVTGDPIAAQKFLESLTEGNTDLANILANAEGSSILIHADGQQILINTDSDNQMLLSVNTDNMNMTESTEGGGNPIFATQPTKNQDILAAALADTDVFQQEQNGSQGKVSQLSPNSTLYPMNVGNVLETSLTLNSPIMTPLEVPSSKKISDESDILNQVPKNVDLPITITDPNISQTVSQQQVTSLMVNELQNNLELSLPISDAAITASTSEMNSPSFVYSLPSLDGTDITQKPFNSSMPLLTEDSEESSPKDDKPEEAKEDKESKITSDGSFLDENEGLCTLGGEMCSSLSEPPPDMFDLSAVLSSQNNKDMEDNDLKIDDKEESSESGNPETASVTETSSPNTVNEDSCEIPVQPEIVTTLDGVATGKRGADEENDGDSKKCKFD